MAVNNAIVVPSENVTHARVPSGPQERALACLELMRKQEWDRGRTPKRLAKQWGIHVVTVRQAAAHAAAIMRREMSDEDLRAEIVARLDSLADLSASGGQFGPAVAALKAMLEARGLLKQRHEVTLSAKPAADVYADALLDEGFRAYLVGQGWTPPRQLVEAAGETVE